MIHISSTQAHSRIGVLIDTLTQDLIVIEKHKKPCAVLMSIQEYTRLKELEDN